MAARGELVANARSPEDPATYRPELGPRLAPDLVDVAVGSFV